MARKYLAFDIETAADIPGPDFNWRPHRPIGITCAALTGGDAEVPIVWHGKDAAGGPAPRMTRDEVREIVRVLVAKVAEGYTIVTWNGLGFDFDVLAEESGSADSCRELALGHVDMMFHVFCEKGFPVSLEKAALAMGIAGKLGGLSGWQAPKLWAAGDHQKVLDYVAQDVRVAWQLAQAAETKQAFSWKTQKGTVSSFPLKRGWLAVRDAMQLAEPDTSWMSNPIPRAQFIGWLTAT
jgi:hypothetical protein